MRGWGREWRENEGGLEMGSNEQMRMDKCGGIRSEWRRRGGEEEERRP